MQAFNKWLSKLPHKHKLVIAGNRALSCAPEIKHWIECADDFSFDPEWVQKNAARRLQKRAQERKELLESQGKSAEKQSKSIERYPADKAECLKEISGATAYLEDSSVTFHIA